MEAHSPQSDQAAADQQPHAAPLSSNPPSPSLTALHSNPPSPSLTPPPPDARRAGSASKRSYSAANNTFGGPASQLQAEILASVGAAERGGKKSRGTGWPLLQSAPGSARAARKGHHRGGRGGGGARARRGDDGRPGKFIEGSMRDRESEAPPSRFLRDEGRLMDEYADGSTGEAGYATEDSGGRLDAGIERARPSSMYRFGKAIANAFSPYMWHGVGGMFREKERAEGVESRDDLLAQRKVKAARSYAELKRSGFFGAHAGPGGSDRGSAERSAPRYSRDSGVDVESYRSSLDRKRDGKVFDENGIPLLPPPPVPGSEDSPSPPLDGSARPASRHRRNGSGLKRLKSHMSLANLRRAPFSPPPLPSVERDETSNKIRKQQSRKDLHKQQKLNQKISNLESQLEKAKRDLTESMRRDEAWEEIKQQEIKQEETDGEVADVDDTGEDEEEGEEEEEEEEEEGDDDEAEMSQEDEENLISVPEPEPQAVKMPSRKFVPGALPSLPSERILNRQANARYLTPSTITGFTLEPHNTADNMDRALEVGRQRKASLPSGQRSPSVAPSKQAGKTPVKKAPAPKRVAAAKKTTAAAPPHKKIARPGRKSGDSIDRPYKPQPDSDGEAEWKQISESTPPNKTPRQTKRITKTKPITPAPKSAPAKKEKEKLTPFGSINSVLNSAEPTLQPESESQINFSSLTSAPADASPPAAADGLCASTLRLFPDLNVNAAELQRARRSMSPPPTATFSKLGTAAAAANLTSNGVSGNGSGTPARSASRGRRGSPSPKLKRAGREGPITVTPGKGGRGVPPVPKVPEGVLGNRVRIEGGEGEEKGVAEGGESGEERADGWEGWGEDVF